MGWSGLGKAAAEELALCFGHVPHSPAWHAQVMQQQQEQLEEAGAAPALDAYSKDVEKLKRTVHELQRELELARAREEKAEVSPSAAPLGPPCMLVAGKRFSIGGLHCSPMTIC